eukprot:514781_1
MDSFLHMHVHIEAWYIAFVILSLLRDCQCQIIGLELQSTPMPIDGGTWATYYESTNRTIWLLSPIRCSEGCQYGKDNIHGDIISYDIDHNLFTTQPSISTLTESMNSQAPQYSVAVGYNIYFNGETGIIDVYDIKTGITTTNINTIPSRDGCLVTDGR